MPPDIAKHKYHHIFLLFTFSLSLTLTCSKNSTKLCAGAAAPRQFEKPLLQCHNFLRQSILIPLVAISLCHAHSLLTAHWLPLINRQTNNIAEMTSR